MQMLLAAHAAGVGALAALFEAAPPAAAPDLALRDNEGRTVLHLAGSECKGFIDTVEEEIAAIGDGAELVQELIARGADPNAADGQGRNALDAALARGDASVAVGLVLSGGWPLPAAGAIGAAQLVMHNLADLVGSLRPALLEAREKQDALEGAQERLERERAAAEAELAGVGASLHAACVDAVLAMQSEEQERAAWAAQRAAWQAARRRAEAARGALRREKRDADVPRRFAAARATLRRERGAWEAERAAAQAELAAAQAAAHDAQERLRGAKRARDSCGTGTAEGEAAAAAAGGGASDGDDDVSAAAAAAARVQQQGEGPCGRGSGGGAAPPLRRSARVVARRG